MEGKYRIIDNLRQLMKLMGFNHSTIKQKRHPQIVGGVLFLHYDLARFS